MGSAAPWKVRGEEKREAVREMFAEVAPTYDRINGIMCVGLHRAWRRAAVRVLDLSEGDAALDVCCGTGDFLVPLVGAVGSGGKVVGVDFCAPMIELARQKVDEPRLSVGDACRLPIRGLIFDAVSVGWGLRNVPDVDTALDEAARVLKPGGRFVSLDMARPKSAVMGRVSEWVFHRVVPLIGRVFGKAEAYTYLPKSTLQFLSREQMAAAMERAGFRDVKWRDYFFGNVCMHWGVKA
jgi:demethylmenaquinone methyltransferase/2-methoxy-6-polyprenyl-1,4-benzoquinol methylase